MSDTAGWTRIAELEAEVKQQRADRLRFSSALGFGDGFSEPAATLEEMVDPILDAFQAARDHDECPRMCELCGERLAATQCDRCYGGGCIPNASWTYEECPPCGGVGWIHDGCAGITYDGLVTERHELTISLASANSRIVQLERAYEALEGAANAWRKEFYVADPWARIDVR